jgi:hypothetical protein
MFLCSYFSPTHFTLLLLLIPQSFDWLAAFHLELLQAILFIAVQLSAPVFLVTCFKYCSRVLLTPCSTVLLEKLPSFQLLMKFPAFYGTWRFITTFKSARQLSLSWGSMIQAIPSHPTSWRSILILSYHLWVFASFSISLFLLWPRLSRQLQ